ncbi:YdcF family protein [Leptodesmis sichuanensis]|uniref:YdcF family protein n=1 Tax=Leptodesmis sichuanensis TaxID=2906798 RepID=UPI001F3C1F89
MTVRGLLQLPNSSTRRPPRFRKKLVSAMALFLLPMAWFSYRGIQNYLTQPQAILVLGGAPERENFAANFARQHPELPIWISSGSNIEYTEDVFSKAGISFNRLHLDRTAVDTVTNFTTLVDELRSKGITSVYLVTSDTHMGRASLVGEIVFGSRGILLKPVSVPSTHQSEPWQKTARDGARALLWVATGHTGSTLSRHFGGR